jgi:hypothetical protein
MSTNTMPGLYKGEERGRPIGEVLKYMAREGRDVVHSQRTRWRENRYMFRGDQWLEANVVAGQVRTVTRDAYMRGSRRRDVFNRLRQMTEGRIALLTSQRPSFEVMPTSRDQEIVSAARQATKFLRTKWGVDEWDLDRIYRELALAGEIDGIAFLSVIFDPSKGARTKVAFDQMGQPITDPAMIESLRMSDPMQETLWKERDMNLGEVVFRIVRAGHLSVDPFAVESFADARWIVETRVRPRDEVEAESGKKLDDMMKGSERSMGLGGAGSASVPGDVTVEEMDGSTRSLDRKDAVIVHEAFVIPHGDWPQGAHVRWADVAPGEPLLVEPWEDELPYMPYTPKPDGGHFLRCHGTVDDLKPIQTRYNRILSLLHEVLDRMARPPIGMPIGALRGNSIYNDSGSFEYHAAMGQPWYMQHPGEPAQFLTHHLSYMVGEMAEIAVQSNAVRGQAPGQGVESAVGVNMLIQQTEQQISGTAAQLQRMYEWGGSRALKLVGKHYIYPRLVNAPGVDDAEEFKAFVGEQLRGCHNMRVTSPITPKSRALQQQTLAQFIPVLGPDIRPYIGRLVDGDVDQFLADEERQRERQRRENRTIASLAAEDKCKTIYADFMQDAEAFSMALRGVQTAQMNGMAPPGDPMGLLMAKGIAPPKLIDMLKDAGIKVPFVKDQDNDPQQLLELDNWTITDGFESMVEMAPWVEQVANEHRRDHIDKLTRNAVAQGEQSMPMPGEKGQPSEAKPKGTPGGQPGQAGGGRPQEPTSAGPTMGG